MSIVEKMKTDYTDLILKKDMIKSSVLLSIIESALSTKLDNEEDIKTFIIKFINQKINELQTTKVENYEQLITEYNLIECNYLNEESLQDKSLGFIAEVISWFPYT